MSKAKLREEQRLLDATTNELPIPVRGALDPETQSLHEDWLLLGAAAGGGAAGARSGRHGTTNQGQDPPTPLGLAVECLVGGGSECCVLAAGLSLLGYRMRDEADLVAGRTAPSALVSKTPVTAVATPTISPSEWEWDSSIDRELLLAQQTVRQLQQSCNRPSSSFTTVQKRLDELDGRTGSEPSLANDARNGVGRKAHGLSSVGWRKPRCSRDGIVR